MSDGTPRSSAEDEVTALRARIIDLEEKLAAHEQYAVFFERSLVMLCVAHGDRFVRLNPAWESTLGWSVEELCARSFLDLIHPDDVERTREAVADLSGGKAAVAFENRYLCKDGSYRHLRWHTAPVDEHGYQHAVAQDITGQRVAEEHARVYEDTIMSSSTGMVVMHLERPDDPSSLRIVAANEAASKFAGIDLRDEIGRRFVEIFPNIAQTEVPAIYTELATRGGARDLGEIPYGDARVEQGVFALRAYGLPDHRVCINFENVTERKKAEAVLRQSIRQEEIIRAQAAALAELSTPLIPVSDDVVVMPLIGAVDPVRAQQVLDTLLGGIAGRGARVAILDITGVATVDTQVAEALARAARGVKLLGARVMLTGIRPDVARTLVALGVDLGGIMTHGSLQAGIAAALGPRGA